VSIEWSKIEEKWRNEWQNQRVFEADPNPAKPKFYMTVAYPYPNSPQHVGHGRTYTLTDVHARYKRMRGYNVLFPMAFHYTGTPVLAIAKKLSSGDEELRETFIKIHGVPENKVNEFTDPLKIAQYFHQEIKEGMKEIGYSIDWRREFTTIDPTYSRFIEWQFTRLREKGLITQGSHPVGWCPNCGNPVGQHDTIGDVEPEIGEYTILKFELDGVSLPAATLRAETVFGVTNMWIRPDIDYVKVDVEGEEWIISEEAAKKLIFQTRKVTIKERVPGRDLLGKTVKNPMTGNMLPILPAAFVDPNNATGVVMSVPAHAPYDYQALEDLRQDPKELEKYGVSASRLNEVRAISLIEVEGYSDVPALDVIKRFGVKNQKDPSLEQATSEIYRKEFHAGKMKANTGKYTGLPVSVAKDRVREDLIRAKKADTMFEIINKPVRCRCGTECVVKMFENQWFINYGDHDWKALAKTCLDQMSILPDEIRSEFEYVFGWLQAKACARKSGLGTRLPWDKEWVIESLSDSVIYMAYYTLANEITKNHVKPENLTNEVFDYVFLGKGNPTDVANSSSLNLDILKEMRKQFSYFYPLDTRQSGRDLVPNHLSFFIFNHVALFPTELWPRQIVVNGSVLMEGKKMSKSLGNILPLRQALTSFGADPLRLAILVTAGLLQDAEFSPILARTLCERVERFYTWTRETIALGRKTQTEEVGIDEKWLRSRLMRAIESTTSALEKLKAREAIQTALYALDQDVQWYTRKKSASHSDFTDGASVEILKEVLETRTKLLAPFTPYVCEEIWHDMGKEGLIANTSWPVYDESRIDVKAEETVQTVKNVFEDTLSIVKATKRQPKQVYYYSCASWKWKVYMEILKKAQSGPLNVSHLMREFMSDDSMKKHAKELAKFVAKCADDISKMAKDARDVKSTTGIIDEYMTLEESKKFFEKELNSHVAVYNEEDQQKVDPKDRARLALPYRPAIYIE